MQRGGKSRDKGGMRGARARDCGWWVSSRQLEEGCKGWGRGVAVGQKAWIGWSEGKGGGS